MARPGAVDLWTYDIVERETLQIPQITSQRLSTSLDLAFLCVGNCLFDFLV